MTLGLHPVKSTTEDCTMNTATIDTPGSLTETYRQRRRAGKAHDDALAATAHAYGRRPKDIEHGLRKVRAECDAPPADKQPAVEVAALGDDAPGDPIADEARCRIAELTVERQRLSLDALTDDKARTELASVEAELAGAEAELERAGLARTEAQRRDRKQVEQAERKAIAAAMQRADELQAERSVAWAKVEKSVSSFAQALGDHHRICGEQTRALATAGQADAWRTVMPPDYTIEKAVKQALAGVGAPASWLG